VASSNNDLAEAKALLKSVPADVVGQRLRRARLKQGLSIRELAAKAEVSKTSIVRLEQGQPTFASTIVRICQALGLHLAGLADPRQIDEFAVVHRNEDDRWFDMTDFGAGPLGGKDKPLSEAERQKLSKDKIAVALLYLRSRLQGGLILPALLEIYDRSEVRSHPGEEMVYILEGTVRVFVGDQTFDLKTGECLTFWSAEAHAYAPAPGSSVPVRALSIRVDYPAGATRG
jgi:transcriptional regulator with XRE-family HTH domain